jgi:hypothetical protein
MKEYGAKPGCIVHLLCENEQKKSTTVGGWILMGNCFARYTKTNNAFI